jgi:hypothetical protein
MNWNLNDFPSFESIESFLVDNPLLGGEELEKFPQSYSEIIVGG